VDTQYYQGHVYRRDQRCGCGIYSDVPAAVISPRGNLKSRRNPFLASWFAEAANADQLEGLRPSGPSARHGNKVGGGIGKNIRSLFCAVQVPSVSIKYRISQGSAGKWMR
jgi:hypothetical protein